MTEQVRCKEGEANRRERSSSAAVVFGVVVFLLGFALHKQFDPGVSLAPIAPEVTSPWQVVLWMIVVWGGWPLALAIASSIIVSPRMAFRQSITASAVVIAIAAFVAASIDSTRGNLGILGGLGFYVPFYVAIGATVELLVLLVRHVWMRRSK